MHIPGHFEQADREKILALIRARPLATVISRGADGLNANHIPLLATDDLGMLAGHVARANPMWSALANDEVLAVFHGPEHYVTPNWYATKAETGRVVPTWNYAVVHVRGRLRVTEDPAWLRAHLEASTTQYEARFDTPWRLEDAPADYTDKLIGAIVGIEIAVTDITAKWKVSQNHPAANHAGVVAGLRALGGDAAAEMAALVETESS